MQEYNSSKTITEHFLHSNVFVSFSIKPRIFDKDCRQPSAQNHGLSAFAIGEACEGHFENDTYLLPCGLQTIMDFSLATLPVETALIFWTFWTWAMDCMVLIICMSAIYAECACAFSEPSLLFFPFPRDFLFFYFFVLFTPKILRRDA
jgi:hypothetical protein